MPKLYTECLWHVFLLFLGDGIDDMISFWVTFASTGNPTTDLTSWKPYHRDATHLILIDHSFVGSLPIISSSCRDIWIRKRDDLVTRHRTISGARDIAEHNVKFLVPFLFLFSSNFIS